jgi:hypothetical protein
MVYKIQFTTAASKSMLLLGIKALFPQVFQLDRVE